MAAVLSPAAAVDMRDLLKVDADLSSTSRLSPLKAPDAFLDLTTNSFLDTEEDILTTPELLREEDKDTLPNILHQGFSPLILVNDSSAGKLVPALRKWCREVEEAGLRRTFKVLYPVRRDTTPQNLANTFGTKLMEQKEFPFLTNIQILDQPVELLSVDERGNPLGTRLQYVAALTYQVTPFTSPLKVSTLHNKKPDDIQLLDAKESDELQSSTLLVLVPRSDKRHSALSTPTESCTQVGHSMSRSHSALALTFPTKSVAQHFLLSNASSNSPLMVGPAAEIFSDTGGKILTITTTKEVNMESLFVTLKPSWLFAVAHTKFRFETKVDIDTLIESIRNLNSWDAPTILSMANDHGQIYDIQGSNDAKCSPEPEATKLAIRISNVHITQLDMVQPFLRTIWDEAPQPRLTSEGLDTLSAEIIVPGAEIAQLFSGKAAKIGKQTWHFQCIEAPPLPANEDHLQQLAALTKVLIDGLGDE